MISKGCTYAIQMAIYLAEREGSFVPVRTISDDLNIPRSFLAKVVSTLSRAGLLDTLRGPAGGVTLARRPKDINLQEIIAAVDGTHLFTECILGLAGCGEEKPCPLHHTWGGVRDSLGTTFLKIAVKDLLPGYGRRLMHGRKGLSAQDKP